MKFIDQLDLQGKRTLIRVDFNVPFDNNGQIADDTRIRATLPTLQLALSKGARTILCSHLGRPKGKRSENYSLKPVAPVLAKIIGRPVKFVGDCIGSEVEKAVVELKDGEVLLLENLRFHPGEESNDAEFARSLGSIAEIYIDDAFANAHRAHASMVAVPRLVPVRAGGLTLKRELDYFARAFEKPERPFAAIFGGSKVSTKMNAIRNVGLRADLIIIGGAMANTFFVAAGHSVGKSLFEPEEVENAGEIRRMLEQKGCQLVLPTDVLVAEEFKAGAKTRISSIDNISPLEMALDIGPDSVKKIGESLASAKTIVWNGPMGAFETPDFSAGTFGVIDILISHPGLRVVGGGDTDLALHQRHAFDKMSYVSTAGGAFLKLLEGRILPAIEALE